MSLSFVVYAMGLALSASASPPAWPALNIPTTMVAAGANDAAVVIGIEDYLFVADVAGAAQNANEWYQYLYKTRRVPLGSIQLLRNTEATRESVLSAVDKAARRVKPGGVLWFVFIGHGAPSRDGRDGLFVGADAQQNATSLFARSVGREQILKLVSHGAQSQTVMLVDACFSGRSGSGQALVAGLQPLIVLTDKVPSKKLTLLTAAKANQFAGALPGQNRPAFSYLVLGALLGWGDQNGDKLVTAEEAWSYSEQVLSAFLTGRLQTPELNAGEPQAVLARQASQSGPDLAALRLAGSQASTQPPPVVRAPQPAAQPGVRPTVATPTVSRALVIETDPTGAPIEVDGRPVGTSPVTVGQLALGSHTIAALFEGRTETQTVYTSATRDRHVMLYEPNPTDYEIGATFSQMFMDMNADEGIYWLHFAWKEWGSRWIGFWLEGGAGYGEARPDGEYRTDFETVDQYGNTQKADRDPTMFFQVTQWIRVPIWQKNRGWLGMPSDIIAINVGGGPMFALGGLNEAGAHGSVRLDILWLALGSRVFSNFDQLAVEWTGGLRFGF